jgi:hypothetical protein
MDDDFRAVLVKSDEAAKFDYASLQLRQVAELGSVL